MPSVETGFLKRELSLGAKSYCFQVFVPSVWSLDSNLPAVLFLHGIGQRGDDGLRQTEKGLPGMIKDDPQKFPFLVVMPQCRAGVLWSEPDMVEMATKALEQEIEEFGCDRRRIYLTGLSMGGHGTWKIAARFTGVFAAAVPVCGYTGFVKNLAGQPAENPHIWIAKRIGKTPVWAFHGEKDPEIPVAESRDMVAALKLVGGNVRYTEYSGVEHNCWDRAYAEPELLPWMLNQRLGA